MDINPLNSPEVKGDSARQRLPSKYGYFNVQRPDLTRIRELGECDGFSVSIPVLIAVWVALVDIANEKASHTFDEGIGVIRHRAGVSRRTAQDALRVLEAHLKMVKHTQNYAQEKKRFHPSTWTIFPAPKPTKARGASGNKNTTPSAKEDDDNSLNSSITPLSGEGNKVEASNALPAKGQSGNDASTKITWGGACD